MQPQTSTCASDVELTTIDEAVKRYKGVSVRMVRAWIVAGRLPATKLGKFYLVSPSDLAQLLRPTIRTAPTPVQRETPNERAERQLRQAGVG